MFTLGKAFATIIAVASITVVSATPTHNGNLSTQSTDRFIPFPHNVVGLCTGALGPDCIHIVFEPLKCVDFTGTLAYLDLQVSTVVIPTGYECLFTNGFGCTPVPDGSPVSGVALKAGTFDLSNVNSGTNFKDKTRSFACAKL